MLNNKDYGIILQILKRCNRIKEKVLTLSKEEFDFNEDIREVICFNIFQIGGLSNGLSSEFIVKYNKIPWKQIKGMRNRIVHGYDTIDLDLVWNTACESIPNLMNYCKEIISTF